jgi:hypothetical protein
MIVIVYVRVNFILKILYLAIVSVDNITIVIVSKLILF